MDVRLTMGGEPTFVAIDDPDGADGTPPPSARPSASTPPNCSTACAKIRPHGLMHFGQGKWYPGEQLPRWSLNCFWRKDGEPIWNAPDLYADERRITAPAPSRPAASCRWPSAWGDVRACLPGLRGRFYYLWRERRLPGNVDPFDSRVDDPLERERLAKVHAGPDPHRRPCCRS
jgi:uncharacterized protein (DUF2126 family)